MNNLYCEQGVRLIARVVNCLSIFAKNVLVLVLESKGPVPRPNTGFIKIDLQYLPWFKQRKKITEPTFSLNRKPFGGSLYRVKILILRVKPDSLMAFCLHKQTNLRTKRAAILKLAYLPRIQLGMRIFPGIACA